MEYRIEQNGEKVEVFFTGDITFSENTVFRQLLQELKSQSSQAGIFDLANVGMVDSAGLGMFLIAREQADQDGWILSLRGAQGHVASMLKLTRLSELLTE